MATPLELAEAAERRKLKAAGLLEEDKTVVEEENSFEEGDESPEDTPSDSPLTKLENDFRAMAERVAPLQRQNEQLRDTWRQEKLDREAERAQLEREIALLRDQLNNKQMSEVDITEGLTEEELGMLDPDVIGLMAKLTKNAVSKMAKPSDVRGEVLRTLDERESQKVGDYRRKLLVDPKKGLHKLAELSYNPAFTNWAKETGVESFVSSLMGASSTEEVDRFSKIIAGKLNEWNALAKGGNPPANGRTSLGSHMRRQPSSGLNEREFADKVASIKSLSRSRSPSDRKRAQELMREIDNNR